MAFLRDLPSELLIVIIKFLVARRTDHFDPAAIKDLHSMRLVTQWVSQVGPHLLLTSPAQRDGKCS